MDKPEQLATLRENQRGNHKWKNQSNWQHSKKPKGNQKWTSQRNWQHREKTKGAIKNGQTIATGNIVRKPKGQSKNG